MSAELADDWRQGGFALYVHWPFCEAKCPYCDFNSHVAASIDHELWADAYLAEIDRVGALTPGRVLNSIYFGGGTPSLMAPATVEAVIRKAADRWHFANDIEITLEANPSSVEADRFAAYRSAGVNRVSIGVQALRDEDLARLGRLHTVDEARRAIDLGQRVFERVSFDLIYAREGQRLRDWEAELREAIALGTEHLSLYQLTIEPGTAFARRKAAGGLQDLPDEDLAADLFLATNEITEAAGLGAYEVSNHARPGAESRHNLVYWRYGDYAGVGPGAHGRLTLKGCKVATEGFSNPRTWLENVNAGGTGERPPVQIPWPEAAQEYLMMSLRLAEGTDLARYARMAGKPINASTINWLASAGLVDSAAGRLLASASGRAVLNELLAELMREGD
ncbi:MAG: coproporphyrinogen III oxidase [Alphaproteobacteria bacterium]|nr:MAG: coproporphyrinogen III oxidase [Alphaproteobacteria bacterium]